VHAQVEKDEMYEAMVDKERLGVWGIRMQKDISGMARDDSCLAAHPEREVAQ
jgi:hypothetical protein